MLKRALFTAMALILFLPSPGLRAESLSIPAITPEDFSAKFYQDVGLLRVYINNIEKTIGIVEEDKIAFDIKRAKDFDLREKEKLYTVWSNFLDHILAFEGLTGYYKDFYLITNRKRHAGSFLIAYASYIAKFSNGLKFIHKTIDNELYEKKLDDPAAEYGIPAGMYAKLKWNTIHIQDLSNILAGYQYFKFLGSFYKKQGHLNDERTAWIFGYVDLRYEYIKKELKLKGARDFTANGLDIFREKTFSAWFPMQMNVSVWMGDTKVKRLHGQLITGRQILDMDKVLKPGDIIVERRNWYLSNVGLPGFWPHAELYTGTYDDMKEYFADPAVRGYYRTKGNYSDFMDYLEKKYPEKMKEFRNNGHDGYPHQIIEAVSEGVKFSSLQEGTSADYIGVMRPRLSKLDISRAIDEAFGYLGRPYDFNFDFLTDSTIVCSELIYKIYLGGKDNEGLYLGLREIAGRNAMPANDIVEKFDRELDKPGQELDFVYFLDGSEKDKRAFIRGLSEFRQSYKRPKWDITQK